MSSIIEIKGLHKVYNSGAVATPALRGVDLDITKGAFVCLVGPSGHGKSTLLHLMGGLDRPTQGIIKVAGEDLNRLNDKALARFRAGSLGIVFQFFNLLRNLTVLENVQLPMMFAQVPTQSQREKAQMLLEKVGLGDKIQAKANQLSGGQMQRVAVARALANEPEVLLMDEPTGNLDSASEKEVMTLVHELHQQGKTIVMVTHNPEIAAQAETVIKIKDGRTEN